MGYSIKITSRNSRILKSAHDLEREWRRRGLGICFLEPRLRQGNDLAKADGGPVNHLSFTSQ